MSRIGKCYNENCEYNIDGVYCDAYEVILSEDGVCETYCFSTKNDDEEVALSYD